MREDRERGIYNGQYVGEQFFIKRDKELAKLNAKPPGRPAVYPLKGMKKGDIVLISFAEYKARNGSDALQCTMETSVRLAARRYKPMKFSFKWVGDQLAVTRKL